MVAIDGLQAAVTARTVLLHAAAAHLNSAVTSRTLPQLAASLRCSPTAHLPWTPHAAARLGPRPPVPVHAKQDLFST